MKEKKSLSPIESATQKLKDIETKEGKTLKILLSRENPEKLLLELAKQIYHEQTAGFENQQVKMLKQANTFAELRKMSKIEKNRHIATVKSKIKSEQDALGEQWHFNLDLLSGNASKPSLPATLDSEKSLLVELKSKGYYAAHVADFDILLCHKNLNGLKKDTPLDKFKIGSKRRYDIVVNGTFFFTKPLGTIIVDGKPVNLSDNSKTQKRGALAQLKDGSFALGMTVDNSEAGARLPFEDKNNPEKTVVNLMAGGALIIRGGKAITGEDIVKVQKFDQPGKKLENKEIEKGKKKNEIRATTAWDSAQLADPSHTLFAIKKGELYVAVIAKEGGKPGKTGKEIQKDLMELGFDSAIIFDGGSRCYLESEEKTIISTAPGKSVSDIPCGFGITIKRANGK